MFRKNLAIINLLNYGNSHKQTPQMWPKHFGKINAKLKIASAIHLLPA